MGEFVWPNGYQSATIFSFDVDGSCAQQLQDGTVLGNHSMGDYGPKVGVPRILNLLDKHNLKGVFFVPAWVAERFPERVKEIHERGHDIGSHGYLHEHFAILSEAEEREVHDKSAKILNAVTGNPPRIFRTPGGPLTSRTLVFLAERDYICDSSSTGDYFPFRIKVDGKEMIELPFSWVTDDFPYFWGGVHSSVRGSGFLPTTTPSEVLEYWVAEFQGIHELGGLCQVLCHPRAIGRASRMRMLEKLVRHIKGTPGVWITSALEVVSWMLRKEL